MIIPMFFIFAFLATSVGPGKKQARSREAFNEWMEQERAKNADPCHEPGEKCTKDRPPPETTEQKASPNQEDI